MSTKIENTPQAVSAQPPNVYPEVLTPSEAAAFLRVTVDQLVDGAKAGRVPGRKLGAERRFLKSHLVEWLGGTAQEAHPDESPTPKLHALVAKVKEEVLRSLPTFPPLPPAGSKERIRMVIGSWKDHEGLDEILEEIYRRRGRPAVEVRK